MEYPIIKSCRVWDKNGKEKRYKLRNRSLRMYYILRKGNFSKIYFKVEYGKAKTQSGKIEMYYNDGEYTDPKEAFRAFKAFWEQS
jgi:hypothetical protein